MCLINKMGNDMYCGLALECKMYIYICFNFSTSWIALNNCIIFGRLLKLENIRPCLIMVWIHAWATLNKKQEKFIFSPAKQISFWIPVSLCIYTQWIWWTWILLVLKFMEAVRKWDSYFPKVADVFFFPLSLVTNITVLISQTRWVIENVFG